MNIYFEILGYVGMALVLLSMMMTSTEKLRMVNIAGSVVCVVYGVLTHTWPTAFLNLGLAIINVTQLIRLNRKKE